MRTDENDGFEEGNSMRLRERERNKERVRLENVKDEKNSLRREEYVKFYGLIELGGNELNLED